MFAKITPAHVEATMFAFTMTILTIHFPIGKFMGIIWNKATFNITNDSLGDLYKLYLLQLGLSTMFVPLLRLIPTWKEIKVI